jgi:hypothetical protein
MAPPGTQTVTDLWTRLNVTGPSGRAENQMAWDPSLNGMLLFGGHAGSRLFNDTWTFINGTWKNITAPNGPPARHGGYLVYDPIDGYDVMFGGSNNSRYLSDTWIFQGGVWSKVHSIVSPPAMRTFAMTWDGGDGYALLFGGHAGSISQPLKYLMYNQTWSFVHGQWKQIQAHGSPPPRAEPSLAYLPQHKLVVLFAGYDQLPGYRVYNQTWTYSNGNWTILSLSVTPPARDGGTMMYDPQLGGTVVYGGHAGYPILNDTWVFQDSTLTWKRVVTAITPPQLGAVAMGYDPSLSGLLIFGGRTNNAVFPAQTWILRVA